MTPRNARVRDDPARGAAGGGKNASTTPPCRDLVKSIEEWKYHRKGEQTMIKLSILMVRRSDLTYEQFIQHWREVHGPLFAAQSESKQYVRRYIQDHRTDDTLPGTTASVSFPLGETGEK
jgi:hypothetical protein